VWGCLYSSNWTDCAQLLPAAAVVLSDGTSELAVEAGDETASFAQEARSLLNRLLSPKTVAHAAQDEAAEDGADASTVRTALSGLNAGRSTGVSVVNSPEQLDSLFDEISRGGTPLKSSYPGEFVRLPDGTTVGLRGSSASGGPTIDIKFPDGEIQKVHIDPWPPTP
jgi:hypothetical protein